MLRHLQALVRNSGNALSSAGASSSAPAARALAAAPGKVSLEQYVEDIRAQIADAYANRVEKYDSYLASFQKLLATSGVPRAHDFEGAKKFAKQRADILRQVKFPEDWKVSSTEADNIREMLKTVPAERKAASAKGSAGQWYMQLSDAQLAECSKDPQLFVELSKLHAFEDQFNAAQQASAAKFGLPPITLDELPPTVDPVGEHAISQREVQWIVKKAKEDAERLRTSDPRYSDPYGSEEFKAEQKRVADRFGISDEMFEKVAPQATEHSRQMAA